MNIDSAFRTLLFLVMLSLCGWAILNWLAPDFIEDPNKFLKTYDAIFLSLGTIVTVGVIAIYTTVLSNRATVASRKADRIIQTELKLSEFRQAWINVLREDLAETISLAYVFFAHDDVSSRDQELQKLKNLDARVRMRLNPRPNAHAEREIEKHLLNLVRSCEKGNEPDALTHREKLATLGANFLKDEWDGIKIRLDKLNQNENR